MNWRKYAGFAEAPPLSRAEDRERAKERAWLAATMGEAEARVDVGAQGGLLVVGAPPGVRTVTSKEEAAELGLPWLDLPPVPVCHVFVPGTLPKLAAELPTIKVGMRVRCLDVTWHRFGEEAEVACVNESGDVFVRSDIAGGWTWSRRDQWLRTVFPCDVSLLHPRVGWHVALRQPHILHDAGVLDSAESTLRSFNVKCHGDLYRFPIESWLRTVWPDMLVVP